MWVCHEERCSKSSPRPPVWWWLTCQWSWPCSVAGWVCSASLPSPSVRCLTSVIVGSPFASGVALEILHSVCQADALQDSAVPLPMAVEDAGEDEQGITDSSGRRAIKHPKEIRTSWPREQRT